MEALPVDPLDSISIQGFKSIAWANPLVLRRLNIVIGPNGAGKSNLMGAFAFLHAIGEGRLQDYVRSAGGADRVLHFGSKRTGAIRIQIAFRDGKNGYLLRLAPATDDALYVDDEATWFWGKSQHDGPYEERLAPVRGGAEAGISRGDLMRTAAWIRQRLGGWRIYHVHDTSSSSPPCVWGRGMAGSRRGLGRSGPGESRTGRGSRLGRDRRGNGSRVQSGPIRPVRSPS